MKSLLSIAVSGCLALSTLAAIGNSDPNTTTHTAQEGDTTVAVLIPTQGNDARGVVYFRKEADAVKVVGRVDNLSPGKHGFHIHQYGDLTEVDGTSAGGHFSPEDHPHGGPSDEKHHAGDFGNITANEQGVAKIEMTVKDLDFSSIIGRGVVVHGGEDDLTSQPSGDAGPRVAVGVIGFANPDN